MNNLEKLRRELDLTQNEIARDLGCNIKTYRSYEKGHSAPGAELLISMRKYFNDKGIPVSTDYILGLSDFRTPENDYIGKHTGLSDNAIECLYKWQQARQQAAFSKQPHDLDTLNTILEHYHEQGVKTSWLLPPFSIFHTIGMFLAADRYEKLPQGGPGEMTSGVDLINHDNDLERYHIPVSGLLREYCKNKIVEALKKIGGIA